MLAKNLDECGKSQTLRVEWLIRLPRGLLKERIKTRTLVRRRQKILPPFIILPSQKKACEIHHFCPLLSGKGFANLNDLFGNAAHSLPIAEGRVFSRQDLFFPRITQGAPKTSLHQSLKRPLRQMILRNHPAMPRSGVRPQNSPSAKR